MSKTIIKSLCCGKLLEKPEREKIKRMCIGTTERTHIKESIRKKILKDQDCKCIYCNVDLFGGYCKRNGIVQHIKINYDHFVPFHYGQDSHEYNMVASCHVCNAIKSNLCFDTLDEAKSYIMQQRRVKKIENIDSEEAEKR